MKREERTCSDEDNNIKNWFENGSWKVYSKIIDDKNTVGQEYVYEYDKVDSDMSICAGIGEYAYKLNIEHGRLTEAEGVCDYNGSKNKEGYAQDVENYMQEMEKSLDGIEKIAKPQKIINNAINYHVCFSWSGNLNNSKYKQKS